MSRITYIKFNGKDRDYSNLSELWEPKKGYERCITLFRFLGEIRPLPTEIKEELLSSLCKNRVYDCDGGRLYILLDRKNGA